MDAPAISRQYTAASFRSSEVRILSIGLPASMLFAALIGFETWLGPRGTYYALAVLPLLPLVLCVAFLRRCVTSRLRGFVLLLAVYITLEWAAEIYYLWYWRTHNGDPPLPSIADLFWLTSYPILIFGCWRAASEHRGFRLAGRDAFAHGVWLAAAAGILIWLTRAVILSDKTLSEGAVLGLYPFCDALVISLLLIIRGRHRAEAMRVFWSIQLFGNIAILVGDVCWLLSRIDENLADTLSKWGDVFYIGAYLLIATALWVGFRLERVRDNPARLTQTKAELKYGQSKGLFNVVAVAPVFFSIVLVASEKSLEKSIERFVELALGVYQPKLSLAFAFLVSCAIAWAFRRPEKRLEAVSIYREEFAKRVHDAELNPAEAAFLERLRSALQLSLHQARDIEGRLLQEKEEELRARLEAVQRQMFEQRSAEEWESDKSAWLGSNPRPERSTRDRQGRWRYGASPDGVLTSCAEPRPFLPSSSGARLPRVSWTSTIFQVAHSTITVLSSRTATAPDLSLARSSPCPTLIASSWRRCSASGSCPAGVCTPRTVSPSRRPWGGTAGTSSAATSASS